MIDFIIKLLFNKEVNNKPASLTIVKNRDVKDFSRLYSIRKVGFRRDNYKKQVKTTCLSKYFKDINGLNTKERTI